jgi:hypothetical protein
MYVCMYVCMYGCIYVCTQTLLISETTLDARLNFTANIMTELIIIVNKQLDKLQVLWIHTHMPALQGTEVCC